jgi:hypothetical protein
VERERLAEAITRHNNAEGRLARLRAALSKAEADNIEAVEVVAARERELAEVRQVEPANLAMVALGEADPVDVGTLVERAGAALAAAEEHHREKRELRRALELEIEAQRRRCAYTEMERSAALDEVVASSPEKDLALAQLRTSAAEFVAAAREVALMMRELSRGEIWLTPFLGRVNALAYDFKEHLELEERPTRWAPALAKLREDPDAALPP